VADVGTAAHHAGASEAFGVAAGDGVDCLLAGSASFL
jgi:hypothetical protein